MSWKRDDMRVADAMALAKTWLLPHNCPSGNVRDCLVKLHQGQGKDFYKNSCASFSEAMTLNLLLGTNYQGGTIAQENQASLYSFEGILGIKYGIPPYIHVHMINDRLKQIARENPDLARYEATYTRDNFPDDLIANLEAGNATIVFVSWETNWEIATGNNTGVGHAMSFVGHDADQDQFYFLDPGEIQNGPILTYTRDALEQHWLETSNIFIPRGSMITYEEVPALQSPHQEPISAPHPLDIPQVEETPSPLTQGKDEVPTLQSPHQEPVSAPHPSDIPQVEETPSPLTQEKGETP